jgi:hypothetical protein
MAAADDWAQGARMPRPRSLAAVCEDPDVQRALAGGAVLAVVPLVFDLGEPA